MRSTAFWRFLAAVAAVALTALPIALCLALRGAEAWKLWHEMSRLGVLVGIVAWVWTAVFLGAATVTIFRIGSRCTLRRWEMLIDAANAVTSALLALECADQHITLLHAFSYEWQVALLFFVFVIPQLTVTFAAREARDIARRLRPRDRACEPATVAQALFIFQLPAPPPPPLEEISAETHEGDPEEETAPR